MARVSKRVTSHENIGSTPFLGNQRYHTVSAFVAELKQVLSPPAKRQLAPPANPQPTSNSDWYAADYYKNTPSRNPQGPASGEYKVLRGGSWFNIAQRVRAGFRGWSDPAVRDDINGFRCVASA